MGSFECSCDSGFLLMSDGRGCEGDFDYYKINFTFNHFFSTLDESECENGKHNCTGSATCVNEIGFFRCTCPSGYQLDGTYASCVGKSLTSKTMHVVQVAVNQQFFNTV